MADPKSCRTCDAPIMWATTHKGKPIPIDLHPSPDGNLVVTVEPGGALSRPRDPLLDKPPFFTSHFATCPNADEHRKSKR